LKICYVSTIGNDENDGATTGSPLASIARAAQIAWDDYTIVVQAGVYRNPVTSAVVGKTPKRLRFAAVGTAILDVSTTPGAAGFSFSNADGYVIDGFTVRGAGDAGIVFKSGSDDIVIRNCRIAGNRGSRSDGIRIQDSLNALIFNNLVYDNRGIGIRIGGTQTGSAGAQVINNTIYSNDSRGIEIGSSQAASPNAVVLNNIIEANYGAQDQVKVESTGSLVGYNGDYNLVYPARYTPGSGRIQGRHDLNLESRVINPAGGDFHLAASSPAIDAGHPLTDRPELRRYLQQRRTTLSSLDIGAIDIGYHYP